MAWLTKEGMVSVRKDLTIPAQRGTGELLSGGIVNTHS